METTGRYSLELAATEAEKLKTKLAAGEAASYDEAAQQLDADKRNQEMFEKNREALEKVIDLLTTHDLKYRIDNENDFPEIMEIGVKASPLKNFKPGMNPLEYISKIRSISKEREDESQQTAQIEKYIESHSNYGTHSNVFYPEGDVTYARDILVSGQSKIEIFENVRTKIQRHGEHVITRMLQQLLQDKAARETAQSIVGEQGFQKLTTYLEKTWNLFQAESPYYSGEEQGQGLYPVALEAGKELLSDEKIWEQLRGLANRQFLKEADTLDRDNRIIHGERLAYSFDGGFVVDAKQPVKLSYHEDFPSQAVIWGIRIPPKNIKGFIESPMGYKKLKERKISTDEEVSNFVCLDQIKNFKIWVRANHLLSEEILKKIDDALKKFWTRDFRSEKPKPPVVDHFKQELRMQEYTKYMEAARRFIEQESPVKFGESYWDGLIRLAEQYQLPIYSTDGGLLWPKQMSHDDLTKYIEKK